MTSHQPTRPAAPDPDAVERDRVDAMFKMLATSTDVAQLMAGVKQQFITEAGYSPENSERCALLLWESSLQVHRLAADPAAGQPATDDQGAELVAARAWMAGVTGAARELLATLEASAAGWRVASHAAFSAAVDSLVQRVGPGMVPDVR